MAGELLSRRPWILLSAPLLVVAAIAVLLRDGDGGPGATPPPPLSGKLVFGVAPMDPDGEGRLFVYDLSGGRAVVGPVVPDLRNILELRTSDAGPGWLVFVAGLPDGGEAAYVLKGMDPGTEPVLLAQGADASFGADATTVVVSSSRRVAEEGPCIHRRVTITMVEVASGRSEPVHREVVRCGDVTSVAAVGTGRLSARVGAGADVLFTRVAEGADLLRVTEDRVRTVLPGFLLISASPSGDPLIVSRWLGGSEAVRPDLHPAVLYRTSPDELVELAIEGFHLQVERVLAWSGTGDRAAVLGTVGGRRGIWLLNTEAGSERRVPIPVGPELEASVPGASFSTEGALFAVAGDEVFARVEGKTFELLLPSMATPPSGPVVWLPA